MLYNCIRKFDIPFSVTLPLLLHFLSQLKGDFIQFALSVSIVCNREILLYCCILSVFIV